MAEKQNCSEPKLSVATARRRASLPTLSRLLKSQTSSFQHRTGATSTRKRVSRGGFKMFLVKAVIGAGAVYLSAVLGVWGEPEDSKKVLTKIKHAISQMENENILSEQMRHDLVKKLHNSTDYLKTQMEVIPESLKGYYDRSEKAVREFIKGKSE